MTDYFTDKYIINNKQLIDSPSKQQIKRHNSFRSSFIEIKELDDTHHLIDLLLSHYCSLEIQNLKLKKTLNILDLKGIKEKVKLLENENKLLVEKLKTENPDIVLHSRPQHERGNGFISIDFTSDNNLELECFGLSEIIPFPDFQIEDNQIILTSSPKTPGGAGTLSNSTNNTNNNNEIIERKLFRHYSVGSSRLSLANRFSLEWGGDEHLRTQSVDGISPRQHKIDIAISSMRLSTSEPLLEMEVKKNFLEFCIIGAKRSILCGKQLPVFGPRQQAEILDNFPHQHHPFIDSMADFAFPVGVRLYMTDSKTYAEHIRSKHCDQYNVFQFSDSFGTLTYACCLIVTETIPLHSTKNAKTIKALKYLEHLENCGNIILRFMKRAHKITKNYERKVILNNRGEVVGYMMVKKSVKSIPPSTQFKQSPLKKSILNKHIPVLAKISSMESDSNSSHSKSSSSNSDSPSHKINDIIGNKLSKLKDDIIHRKKKTPDPPRTGGAELPSGILKNGITYSNHIQPRKLQAAKLDYQYVVTQRAYCMLSAQPQHALLFQVDYIIFINIYLLINLLI